MTKKEIDPVDKKNAKEQEEKASLEKKLKNNQQLHKLLEKLLKLKEINFGNTVTISDYSFHKTLSTKNIDSFTNYTHLVFKKIKKEKYLKFFTTTYSQKIIELSIDIGSDFVFIDIVKEYFPSFSEFIKLFERYVKPRCVYVRVYPLELPVYKSDFDEKQVDTEELILKPVVVKNGLNGS